MNYRVFTTICVFLLTLFSTWIVRAEELQILVKETVTLKGDGVLLGKIADFQPENHPLVSKLASLRLCASPPPGERLLLDHQYLIYKLQSILRKERGVKVKIPETLVVHRAAQVVDQETLRSIFTRYITKSAPWSRENITFDSFSGPRAIYLPQGKLTWRVKKRGRGDWSGTVSLVVTFLVDGKIVKKVPISGKIKIRQRVVRASRDLPKGHILQRDDLIVTSEMTYYPLGESVDEPKSILGMKLVRPVKEAQAITKSMVRKPPAVKKGERVTILAENSRFRIMTLGMVLEEGAIGDQVKVINLSSGKQIFATVKGHGRVCVKF